jgi:hypothetical protein
LAIVVPRRSWLEISLWKTRKGKKKEKAKRKKRQKERKGPYQKEKRSQQPSSTAEIR